jgi:CheY-like chemotaxis protein
MLQNHPVSDEQHEEGLRVIERSAESQKQLLDDLLDTSRIASGKMRLSKISVDVTRVVQLSVESIAPLAKERDVSVHFDKAKGVNPILADPDRLRQVIGNLLMNALKFTPSGGSITISLAQQKRFVELSVADTGQGIEPQFLPHIFTPFSQADFSATRAYGGLGLGLSICRELVELHGGTIEARSPGRGGGSTFIVCLPLPHAEELEAFAETDVQTVDGDDEALRGVRILFVEDDAATQRAVAQSLRRFGAEVTTADDADGGFDAFAQTPPNIILSDIGLPKEDGHQLLQRIRTLEAERGMASTPAVALTAFAGAQHRRRALDAGYDEHLAKPIKAAVLAEKIARILAERSNH